jgi:hypothetical protein
VIIQLDSEEEEWGNMPFKYKERISDLMSEVVHVMDRINCGGGNDTDYTCQDMCRLSLCGSGSDSDQQQQQEKEKEALILALDSIKLIKKQWMKFSNIRLLTCQACEMRALKILCNEVVYAVRSLLTSIERSIIVDDPLDESFEHVLDRLVTARNKLLEYKPMMDDKCIH